MVRRKYDNGFVLVDISWLILLMLLESSAINFERVMHKVGLGRTREKGFEFVHRQENRRCKAPKQIQGDPPIGAHLEGLNRCS